MRQYLTYVEQLMVCFLSATKHLNLILLSNDKGLKQLVTDFINNINHQRI